MERLSPVPKTPTPAFAWLALMLWISPVAPVAAHAIVMDSEPEAGAVLAPGKHRFELRFNNRIDRKRSRLVLAGPMAAPGTTSPERAQVLLDGPGEDVLVTELQVADAGRYRLRWQVLALDGHVTRGEVPFSVVQPAP